jgi:hypothetical protein
MAKGLNDVYVGVNQSDANRRENDFYPTPPLVTYILHKYSKIPTKVVEPCAGRGNIAVELKRCGYDVKAFDLNEYADCHYPVEAGHDVMILPKVEGYDGFVTNPPYFKDLPRKIAEKAIPEYEYTAMFLRLTFLEGQKRKQLFTKHTPSDIIILSDRVKFEANLVQEPIDFENQIGGMISYMWIIWDKKTDNKDTKIKWVSLKEEYEEWRKHYENTFTLPVI